MSDHSSVELITRFAEAVRADENRRRFPPEEWDANVNRYRGSRTALTERFSKLEADLTALRRWEKTVRENSPLLLLLAQAEKNALFDVQAFLEHMDTLADNARENGFMVQADAVEDMMDELRQWPVSSPWKAIEEAEKEGPARLLYSPDFVSLDFNPEGVIEGAWMNNPDDDDEECWVAAVWTGCHDQYVTKKVEPTHFMMKPVPPNGVNQ